MDTSILQRDSAIHAEHRLLHSTRSNGAFWACLGVVSCIAPHWSPSPVAQFSFFGCGMHAMVLPCLTSHNGSPNPESQNPASPDRLAVSSCEWQLKAGRLIQPGTSTSD